MYHVLSVLHVLMWLTRCSHFHTQYLLAYLHQWLQRYWSTSETHVRTTHRGTRIPTLSQALDWMSLLIDAHFARLRVVMMQDEHEQACHTLMQHIQTMITARYVPMCESLSTIRGLVDSFRTQHETQQKQQQQHAAQGTVHVANSGDVIADYSVEVLHF